MLHCLTFIAVQSQLIVNNHYAAVQSSYNTDFDSILPTHVLMKSVTGNLVLVVTEDCAQLSMISVQYYN